MGQSKSFQKDYFKKSFNDEYKLALQEGNKRFGSECKHMQVKGGICINCKRKVLA